MIARTAARAKASRCSVPGEFLPTSSGCIISLTTGVNMRESEMRQRIEGLLRRRMQGVLAPALGLGLALVGCGCGGTEYGAQFPHHVDADDVTHDAAASWDTPIYDAPLPADAPPAEIPPSNDTLPPGVDGVLDSEAVSDAPVDVAQTDADEAARG